MTVHLIFLRAYPCRYVGHIYSWRDKRPVVIQKFTQTDLRIYVYRRWYAKKGMEKKFTRSRLLPQMFIASFLYRLAPRILNSSNARHAIRFSARIYKGNYDLWRGKKKNRGQRRYKFSESVHESLRHFVLVDRFAITIYVNFATVYKLMANW